MMLVPAGPPVDAVIRDLLPYLENDDLIIDGGNSFFKDTDLRAKTLSARDLSYMGVGISGGEHGARTGPSLMPGGPHPAYDRVQAIFESVAAQVGGEPCVTYLGPGSAGHYVKMVHNGIEYGLMQLIAESYDLLKRGSGLNDDKLHEVYDQWNQTDLSSYLLEITANIFCQPDEVTGSRLIDVILDEARQKGTGMWTSQDAMDLGVPTPSIDAAVSMRNLSALRDQREAAGKVLARPVQPGGQDLPVFLNQLQHAMYASMVTVYAQGMALLRQASAAYGYELKLADVARIWRGGCIIRSALLEPIRAAYQAQPDLPNLLVDPHLSAEVMSSQEDLRKVVAIAAQSGIPAPGMAASLAYLDAYRSAWLPANLIQAQRDYFGAHTYERVDNRGTFHTRWEGE
jgi:6-phosphogluconate dehydrogenase